MHSTVHELIAAMLGELPLDSVVLDLGAGSTGTLPRLTHGRARPSLAIDIDFDVLASRQDAASRVQADLAVRLPIADAAVDVVVSHNTLECLPQPAALLAEIYRVLRPDGRALLAHTDFDTIVVAAARPELSRRVCQTYSDLPVLYRHMRMSDPQLGRKLPGLVRASPLSYLGTVAHVTTMDTLTGPAKARIEEMEWAVRRAAAKGLGLVSDNEVDEWLDDLARQDEARQFFFSETAYLVDSRRR